MKVVSILLVIIFFMGCKTEPKKEVTKESDKAKEIVVKTSTVIESESEEVKEILQEPKKQIPLDYSLKAENVKTLQDSATYLKHYYKQFVKTKDSVSEMLFFEMLPDTFKEFNQLYGFSEKKGGMPLYGETHTLEYDDIRKYIVDSTYYKKLINLGIKGYWDADNISMLQEVLQNSFLRKSILFSQILENKKEAEKESFWKFFFDGPHPENQQEVYNDILYELTKIDETMVPVVKSAYAKVKEDWAEH